MRRGFRTSTLLQVDWISSSQNGGQPTIGFPLFDARGNMTACLFRSGTNSYTLGNLRTYDAWGLIRSGASSGDPKGRYCANLGHKQDDESGLIYMRARYYEPGSGRFISEDSDRDGFSWFSYCRNDPLNQVDSSGKSADLAWGWLELIYALTAFAGACLTNLGRIVTAAGLAFAAAWIGTECLTTDVGTSGYKIRLSISSGIFTGLAAMFLGETPQPGSILSECLGAIGAYTATIALVLAVDDIESASQNG